MIYQGEFELNNNNNNSNTVYNKVYPKDVHALLFLATIESIYTVKPLLSRPPIKWTPSIKRTLSRVLKLTSYISLYNELQFSEHLY